MLCNTNQQNEMVEGFVEAVGREFLDSFDRGHNWSDEELFLLIHFQKRQELKALGVEDQVQQIHDDLRQFVIFQIGYVQVPLSDVQYQQLDGLINEWINQIYWYNSDLAGEINSGKITESIADERLIERYYRDLYYKVAATAFNTSKEELGDEYYKGSQIFNDLNLHMTNLYTNMLTAQRFNGDKT